MIAIVDYGVGNIQAFANIYRRLGLVVVIARRPEDLSDARKIVLPGVGAFDWAMQKLNTSGMRDTLDEMVMGRKVDVLGVCVGMQMMAQRSEEGNLSGLGWIDAEVVRFDTNDFTQRTHLPHMGWNDVEPVAVDTLFSDIEAPRFYFLHSYYMVTNKAENILATTTYGVRFTSAARAGNVFGSQFHPEKSHDWGIRVLRNFAQM